MLDGSQTRLSGKTLASATRSVLLITANPYYELHGIRPGVPFRTATRRVRLTAPFRIGRADWYLLPNGPSRGVVEVRGGRVVRVGIADRRLTADRRRAARLLRSFV